MAIALNEIVLISNKKELKSSLVNFFFEIMFSFILF